MEVKQVISPHIDDAILSLGGCILNWVRNGEKVKIINVFSKAGGINKDSISVLAGKRYPTDFKSAMKIKKAEEKNIQNILKIEVEFLDWPDRNINIYSYKGDFFYKKSAIERLKNDIRRKIDKDSPAFFPLAMGELRTHADHIIARQIGLFLLKDGYDIRFYEDLPYFYGENLRGKISDFFQTIKKQGVSFLKEKHAMQVDESLFSINDYFKEIKLIPVTEEIDIDEKVKILGFYESQMEADWLAGVRRHALSSEDNKYYETYWKPVCKRP
jgi:LmbE family N-acetylglucosaminyl deacetylase